MEMFESLGLSKEGEEPGPEAPAGEKTEQDSQSDSLRVQER